MSIKVKAENYPEIIEVYNRDGKSAASELLSNKFKIAYPKCLLSQLRKKAELGYDREADCFRMIHSHEDELFLNLEELCSGSQKPAAEKADKTDRAEAMEKLVSTLISDRLLELSRYMLLDPVSKRIMINKSSMQADGYCVVID